VGDDVLPISGQPQKQCEFRSRFS